MLYDICGKKTNRRASVARQYRIYKQTSLKAWHTTPYYPINASLKFKLSASTLKREPLLVKNTEGNCNFFYRNKILIHLKNYTKSVITFCFDFVFICYYHIGNLKFLCRPNIHTYTRIKVNHTLSKKNKNCTFQNN